jgi:hypothetical protein
MITFGDGSSIFSHGIDNTVFLQKFDPYGVRPWPGGLVVAHDNDSSDFGGGSLIVSDGAGGAVVCWYDHRGAFQSGSFYLNDALYMQRVDNDGVVRWQTGGVLVVPPDSGMKQGRLVSDGSGGAIVAGIEDGFGYPGAPNRNRIFAARIDGNGTKRWDVTLESSDSGGIVFIDAARAGRYIYVEYKDYRGYPLGQDFTWIIDTAGVAGPPPWIGTFTNVAWKDSVLFSNVIHEGTRAMRKVDQFGDIEWSTPYSVPDSGCLGGLPFRFIILVPDNVGGAFYLYTCQDTIYRFRSDGTFDRRNFPMIAEIGHYIDYSGDGGLVIANGDGLAQRWDSLGIPTWGSLPIVYQSDPENSEFEDYWGDKNGGIITTFFALSQGLSAQHTGRYGQPGVIVTFQAETQSPIPLKAFSFQNFPNPFNSSTTIFYTLPSRAHVFMEIVNILGQQIEVLVDKPQDAGDYAVSWSGETLPSGVYFSTFKVNGNTIKTSKMILAR